MAITPAQLPELLTAIEQTLKDQGDTIAELDQAIGDGDHLDNLLRGLKALQQQAPDWTGLSWPGAFRAMGMTIMSSVGGASGSLYATLFIAMSKANDQAQPDLTALAQAFAQGVSAVKQRGRAEQGEKTMVDVLSPVAKTLTEAAEHKLSGPELANRIIQTAEQGVASTRGMLASKGRASFLGERSKGHIDAGAKTSALILSEIVKFTATG